MIGFASAASLSAKPVTLSWTDNSDNEFGFEIHRATEDSDFKRIGITAPNINEFTDNTANPYLDYSYKVRAFNDFGRSGFSNIADRQALNQVEGEGNSGERPKRPTGNTILQTPPNPVGRGTSLNAFNAEDFDFTKNSIAGFTIASESTASVLLRMTPGPYTFDRSLSTWKTNASLEYMGSNKDWRFSDHVILISNTIRELGLTPPNPYVDPAMLIAPNPGQHMALMKGSQSLQAIDRYELIDTGGSETMSNQLTDLYVVGHVGAEQGGIAITFRVNSLDPQRFTFYASTPQFATEQNINALLEPALYLHSLDGNIQYSSASDLDDEATPTPIFEPTTDEKIAALQVTLPPGVYTATAFSLSGRETSGILALSIQN